MVTGSGSKPENLTTDDTDFETEIVVLETLPEANRVARQKQGGTK
jgi:hypothetical protein